MIKAPLLLITQFQDATDKILGKINVADIGPLTKAEQDRVVSYST